MRQRKVRRKRRKPMTADDMRKGVTFQTGLTGKAKLALIAVVLAGIALTIVVMLAVNGSFSLRQFKGDDNPQNSGYTEDGAFDLDAFTPGEDTSDEGIPARDPGSATEQPDPGAKASETPAAGKPADDFFEINPFQE